MKQITGERAQGAEKDEAFAWVCNWSWKFIITSCRVFGKMIPERELPINAAKKSEFYGVNLGQWKTLFRRVYQA